MQCSVRHAEGAVAKERAIGEVDLLQECSAEGAKEVADDGVGATLAQCTDAGEEAVGAA